MNLLIIIAFVCLIAVIYILGDVLAANLGAFIGKLIENSKYRGVFCVLFVVAFVLIFAIVILGNGFGWFEYPEYKPPQRES